MKGSVVLVQRVEDDNIAVWGRFKDSTSEEAFSSPEAGGDPVVLRLANGSCSEVREGGGAWRTVSYIDSVGNLSSRHAGEELTAEGVVLIGHEDIVRSLVIVRCPEGVRCEDVDEVFDCAELVAKKFELTLEIIIVLAVAAGIFFVIVICIPVIYCCCKSRSCCAEKRQKERLEGGGEEEGDSVDDPFLMNGRHTKSEISIPYMDASLPPTPKVDRVWDQTVQFKRFFTTKIYMNF